MRIPKVNHSLAARLIFDISSPKESFHLIYTETMNDTVYLAPRLIEQGCEDTWFRKVDGRWFITKRLVTQDGGLLPAYMNTYKERQSASDTSARYGKLRILNGQKYCRGGQDSQKHRGILLSSFL